MGEERRKEVAFFLARKRSGDGARGEGEGGVNENAGQHTLASASTIFQVVVFQRNHVTDGSVRWFPRSKYGNWTAQNLTVDNTPRYPFYIINFRLCAIRYPSGFAPVHLDLVHAIISRSLGR